MTACIHFHPEAFSTTGPRLMGRHAAGESFLRAHLQHSRAPAFWIQVDDPAHAEAFRAAARAHGRSEPVQVVGPGALAELARPGTLFLPHPELAEHAFRRGFHGHASWSLYGITHTTASARAMDAVTGWLTAPLQPWDAVICTSSAVRDQVARLLTAQGEFLRHRLGATRLVQPHLPVIPLGVHCDDFLFRPEERAAARAALPMDDDTVVVLFMGRLSFHAKAHPLALYQALERAVGHTGVRVLLLECGWHATPSIREAFEEAATVACPSVRRLTLDGRRPELRRRAWAAADVFASLSDNVQETFGLTPVEAMAAGLPQVVSDWDGYRDTVRDGVDGFRVPTWMPPPGLGQDLAVRHAYGIDTYDAYCGHVCSLVAVDVPAASRAFADLLGSADLRRRMGAAGRARAREVFDWAVILPRYDALEKELAERRRSASPTPRTVHPWPARMDPFQAFAAYPTHPLTPRTLLVVAGGDGTTARERLGRLRALKMVSFAGRILPRIEELEDLLGAAAAPTPAGALLAGVPERRRPLLFRSLVWLLKLGVLTVAPDPPTVAGTSAVEDSPRGG